MEIHAFLFLPQPHPDLHQGCLVSWGDRETAKRSEPLHRTWRYAANVSPPATSCWVKPGAHPQGQQAITRIAHRSGDMGSSLPDLAYLPLEGGNFLRLGCGPDIGPMLGRERRRALLRALEPYSRIGQPPVPVSGAMLIFDQTWPFLIRIFRRPGFRRVRPSPLISHRLLPVLLPEIDYRANCIA
jgi:hypothetical protein